MLSSCALFFGPERDVAVSVQYMGSYLKENNGVGNEWGSEVVTVFGTSAPLSTVITRELTTWDDVLISIEQVELDDVYNDVGRAEFRRPIYLFIKEHGAAARISIGTYVYEDRGGSTTSSSVYAVWESLFDINIAYLD